jgi:hypothetical protein
MAKNCKTEIEHLGFDHIQPQTTKGSPMRLSSGPIPLISHEFDDILEAVGSFHDGNLCCASFTAEGPMAFIDLIWFGQELSYNPRPIIGGVFWFDLNDLREVHDFVSHHDREIGDISLNKTTSSIKFQFQDEPYEKLEFKFGPEATFQFIASSSLDDVNLERR